MEMLPKDWIINETILTTSENHVISSMTVLQTNQGHKDTDPDSGSLTRLFFKNMGGGGEGTKMAEE